MIIYKTGSWSAADFKSEEADHHDVINTRSWGERGGSVVECRTPEREVRGSKPTAAVLCPWARHFTPRKYWLITQEAVAPSRHDWKIVDWDVKPQHKQKLDPDQQKSIYRKTGSSWCCIAQNLYQQRTLHLTYYRIISLISVNIVPVGISSDTLWYPNSIIHVITYITSSWSWQ